MDKVNISVVMTDLSHVPETVCMVSKSYCNCFLMAGCFYGRASSGRQSLMRAVVAVPSLP